MCKCDNLFELTDLHKAHQLTQQDVRNIQIVKEQKSSKEKISFHLKTRLRATDLREKWWSQAGSNRRPPACKAGALPAELWPRNLSFFRLALLVARSPDHILVRKPLRQSEKIPRYRCSFSTQIMRHFRQIKAGRPKFSLLNEGLPTPIWRKWWVWEDLNFRPHPYQGCALTN